MRSFTTGVNYYCIVKITPSESGNKSEKDQRKVKTIKDKNDKHHSKFSLSLPISFGANGP